MHSPLSGPETEALIVRGRACVRMIEAGRVLLAFHTDPHQRATLGEAVELAQAQLRELVRDLEPALTAQIMIVSEKIVGVAQDIGLN